MEILLNKEKKIIHRHLCLQFKSFFFQAGLEGVFDDYNIYVNDVMYWVYGDLEIYPIIQNGMKVHLVHKNEDPQYALIKDLGFKPELVSRPEKKQITLFAKPFQSKTQIIKPKQSDIEPKKQQDFHQTMPKQLIQQIQKQNNNKKEVLVRFPFLFKSCLVVGIQIINNIEQTIEIFYQLQGCPVRIISESDQKISMSQFSKEARPRDQLIELINYRDISVYWADDQQLLLVQWPDYALTEKFINKN